MLRYDQDASDYSVLKSSNTSTQRCRPIPDPCTSRSGLSKCAFVRPDFPAPPAPPQKIRPDNRTGSLGTECKCRIVIPMAKPAHYTVSKRSVVQLRPSKIGRSPHPVNVVPRHQEISCLCKKHHAREVGKYTGNLCFWANEIYYRKQRGYAPLIYRCACRGRVHLNPGHLVQPAVLVHRSSPMYL